MKIYIASKAHHRPTWRKFRDDLGINIISRWIDTDDKFSVNSDGLDYVKLWDECLRDVIACDVLVCYAIKGEVLKGALIEIGAAFGLKKEVIITGDREAFEANGTWVNYDGILDACDASVITVLRELSQQ